MNVPFLDDLEKCLKVLQGGGTILYPTDTVWGLGCDATNKKAVEKIYLIKQRSESKSLIILIADEKDILHYVAAPDLAVFDFIQNQKVPTTVVFDNGIGLADNLLAEDGSIAIRIIQDEFCKHLIRRLKKPVVSTSANMSGQPSPQTFSQISKEIQNQVDYVVKWRQNDQSTATPSQVVKWESDGSVTVLRP